MRNERQAVTTTAPVIEVKKFRVEGSLTVTLQDPVLIEAFAANPKTPEMQKKVDELVAYYNKQVMYLTYS